MKTSKKNKSENPQIHYSSFFADSTSAERKVEGVCLEKLQELLDELHTRAGLPEVMRHMKAISEYYENYHHSLISQGNESEVCRLVLASSVAFELIPTIEDNMEPITNLLAR